MHNYDDYLDPYTHESYGIQPEQPASNSPQKKAGMGKTAVSLIRVAVIMIIGVTIFAAVPDTTSSMAAGGVTIHITENPLDGDIITLEDDVFEFDFGDGVANGHIPVQIAGTAQGIANNLKYVLVEQDIPLNKSPLESQSPDSFNIRNSSSSSSIIFLKNCFRSSVTGALISSILRELGNIGLYTILQPPTGSIDNPAIIPSSIQYGSPDSL
ncbi:hypothetical protein MSHOH_1569 [Methanosarcina horonobensis HB-1 = JCM 15518]|uniref:Uncharacterized protein n=1 Tax=Methanosarcina horonobensis HB-1 = JCM 15518 TaxID=1434110 RepID=A0A0E3SD96_9EURY|nr:hypothetical protein [Methanosarcina horonobensis]AKB78052.1 hypothetical protein MSHOH_1569 [Methanosarcina horonobensis HB-1 = JCM 15518]